MLFRAPHGQGLSCRNSLSHPFLTHRKWCMSSFGCNESIARVIDSWALHLLVPSFVFNNREDKKGNTMPQSADTYILAILPVFTVALVFSGLMHRLNYGKARDLLLN